MALFVEKDSKHAVGPFPTDKKCRLCGKRYLSTFCQQLHEHVHKVNGRKCENSMKRCVVCNKSFEKESVYRFHKQQFHKKLKGDDMATTIVFPSWYVTEKAPQISSENGTKVNGSVVKKEKRPFDDAIGRPCLEFVYPHLIPLSIYNIYNSYFALRT